MPTLSAQGPILPLWLVMPMAIVTAVIVAGHMIAVRRAASRMPPSRVRIRLTTGVVMLVLIPLLAYGFSVADASNPREFVLAWLGAMGLLGTVVLLALVDIINNIRLAKNAHDDLAAEAATLQAHLASQLKASEIKTHGGEPRLRYINEEPIEPDPDPSDTQDRPDA